MAVTEPKLFAGQSQFKERAITFLRRARTESLLQNSLFMMATTLATSAFGYVYWLVAAHLFSASAVGLTAAITSACTIVVLISCLGVGGTFIQTLPGHGADRGWSEIFWAGAVTSTVAASLLAAIAIAVLPLASPHLRALHDVRYAALLISGAALLAAGATFDYVYISRRRSKDMFKRNSVAAAAKVLALVPLGVLAGAGALRLLAAWGVACIVGASLGISLLSNAPVRRPPGLSILLRTALDLRSRLAGHQLIGMGAALLPYLLPLLVTARLSARENAYFYTAWMLAGIFFIISPALSQSLFAEGIHKPDALKATVRSAAQIMAVLLLPGLVIVLASGSTLLSAFGHAYASHASDLLRLAALAAIPDAVTNVYVAVLRVRGRLASAAMLNLGMGLGILVMSWFLLPTFGISAIGWAFLTMQLSGCAYVAVDVHREHVRHELIA